MFINSIFIHSPIDELSSRLFKNTDNSYILIPAAAIATTSSELENVAIHGQSPT